MSHSSAANKALLVMTQKKNATEKEFLRKLQQVNREQNQRLSKINQDRLEIKELMEHIKICNSDKDPSAIRLLGNRSNHHRWENHTRTNSIIPEETAEVPDPPHLHIVTKTIDPINNAVQPPATAPNSRSHHRSRRGGAGKRHKTPIGTRITRFLDCLETDKSHNDLEIIDSSQSDQFRLSRTLSQAQWQERIKRWNPLMAYDGEKEEDDSETNEEEDEMNHGSSYNEVERIRRLSQRYEAFPD